MDLWKEARGNAPPQTPERMLARYTIRDDGLGGPEKSLSLCHQDVAG